MITCKIRIERTEVISYIPCSEMVKLYFQNSYKRQSLLGWIMDVCLLLFHAKNYSTDSNETRYEESWLSGITHPLTFILTDPWDWKRRSAASIE